MGIFVDNRVHVNQASLVIAEKNNKYIKNHATSKIIIS